MLNQKTGFCPTARIWGALGLTSKVSGWTSVFDTCSNPRH